MWPFRRAPEIALPDWQYSSLGEGRHSIRFAAGDWFVSDGGHPRDAIALGPLAALTGSGSVQLAEGRMAQFSLRYVGTQEPSFHEIVIDSGTIVFFCQPEFAAASIDSRAGYALLKRVERDHPKYRAVSVQNSSDECVALLVVPPDGDGVYALNSEAEKEYRTLRLDFTVAQQ